MRFGRSRRAPRDKNTESGNAGFCLAAIGRQLPNWGGMEEVEGNGEGAKGRNLASPGEGGGAGAGEWFLLELVVRVVYLDL